MGKAEPFYRWCVDRPEEFEKCQMLAINSAMIENVGGKSRCGVSFVFTRAENRKESCDDMPWIALDGFSGTVLTNTADDLETASEKIQSLAEKCVYVCLTSHFVSLALVFLQSN